MNKCICKEIKCEHLLEYSNDYDVNNRITGKFIIDSGFCTRMRLAEEAPKFRNMSHYEVYRYSNNIMSDWVEGTFIKNRTTAFDHFKKTLFKKCPHIDKLRVVAELRGL